MNLFFHLFVLASFLLFVQPKNDTPLTPEDLFNIPSLGTAALSPDKKWAVYPLTVWDETKNVSTTWLQLLNLETKQSKQLTFPPQGKADRSPTFSPEGDVVAFLSNRADGGSQVYTVEVNAAEPEATVSKLTDYPLSLSSFSWSHPSGRLLFSTSIYVECTGDQKSIFDCTLEKEADFHARGNSGFLYDQLYVRFYSTWTDWHVSHLFVVSVSRQSEGKWLISSDAIDVMETLNANVDSFDLSADGSFVAFSVGEVNREMAFNTDSNLYIRNLRDFSLTCLTCLPNSYTSVSDPVFSPNGRFLAYLMVEKSNDFDGSSRIFLYDFSTDSSKRLAPSWDRSPSSLVWSPNGNYLLVDTDDLGARNLFVINLSDQVFQLTTDGTNKGVNWRGSSDSSESIVFTRSTYTSPDELWTLSFPFPRFNKTQIQLSKLTSETSKFTSGFYIGEPEKFWFESRNSSLVQGYFFKPMNFDPHSSWPLLVFIHGGPTGAWNDKWSTYYNPQLWIARGYALLLVNPHGSVGFGYDFTESVVGNWGGDPYFDIMTGVDYVLQQHSWLDRTRTGVVGHSYGGYMVNWVLGQTDRFKCAIIHAGIFGTDNFGYTTDIVGVMYFDFEGTPYQNPSKYFQWNPRERVDRWVTPTLVVHGGLDYRVPLSEGLGSFTALQRRGIPSKFMYFPDEGHNIQNPRNYMAYYTENFQWLDSWLSK